MKWKLDAKSAHETSPNLNHVNMLAVS